MRHAEAGWAAPGQRDFDRPLNEKGYAEAETVADSAADHGYAPDLVICSTALRCRQTADAIRRVVSVDTEFSYLDELYNASADTYLAILAAQNGRAVMIIGHNPTIEEVLERLTGHEATHNAIPGGYPTAGLAVLDWSDKGTSIETTGWILSEMVIA